MGEAGGNDIAISVKSSQQLSHIQSSRYCLYDVISARKIHSVAIFCAGVNSGTVIC